MAQTNLNFMQVSLTKNKALLDDVAVIPEPLLITVWPSDILSIATGLARFGGGGGGGGNIPGAKKWGNLFGLFIGGVVEFGYKI